MYWLFSFPFQARKVLSPVWTLGSLHPLVNTYQSFAERDMAEATHSTAKWQMDINTGRWTDRLMRSNIETWQKPWQEKLHIIVNRWEPWMQSCLSVCVSLCLSSLPSLARVQQFSWAEGESMEAVRGHMMLPLQFTHRDRERLIARTWRRKEICQTTVNLIQRAEGRH